MKKYDLLVFTIFCILVSLLAFPIASAHLPLSGTVIYLDPGHGGVDPGSLVGNIYEKDINLAISKFLEEELSKYGAIVFLTRDGDYDLGSPNAKYRKKSDFDNRIKKINQSKANYYLSIHLNMLGNPKYFGPQVFYNEKKEMNLALAEHIQKFLNEKLETQREVKKIPSTTYMYSKLNVPGVLIECGFLSNVEERLKLVTVEYQKKIASLIADAIVQYAI